MPVVRLCAYRMRGSWGLGGSCMAAGTACGRTSALPSGTHVRKFRSVLEHASIQSPSRDKIYRIFPTESHVQDFRSVFEHASIRSPSRTTHRYFFGGSELEQNRINGDQLFCARDRARESFLLQSIGLLEQFLERDHARATRASLLAGIFT